MRLLTDAYGDTAARSWFFGANNVLADRAPELVLRQATEPGDIQDLNAAARTFVAGGPS